VQPLCLERSGILHLPLVLSWLLPKQLSTSPESSAQDTAFCWLATCTDDESQVLEFYDVFQSFYQSTATSGTKCPIPLRGNTLPLPLEERKNEPPDISLEYPNFSPFQLWVLSTVPADLSNLKQNLTPNPAQFLQVPPIALLLLKKWHLTYRLSHDKFQSQEMSYQRLK
jgi:hypothetical protein